MSGWAARRPGLICQACPATAFGCGVAMTFYRFDNSAVPSPLLPFLVAASGFRF